jgi:hypothetical protein
MILDKTTHSRTVQITDCQDHLYGFMALCYEPIIDFTDGHHPRTRRAGRVADNAATRTE